jgi:hypothetical protein
MRVGTLVLTQENKYLIDKELPDKPAWDKEWLRYLVVSCKGIDASPATIKDMPRWIKQKQGKPWDLNLGISTLAVNPPDLLLITRVYDEGEGPKFRLDDWELVDVEVWKRKEK